MAEGSPDYTKLVQILGRDEEGNLVTVRVDPFGRIILLPYGTQTIEGGVAVTGDGQDKLVSLAVDEEGRLIMLPYGTTTVDGAVAVSGEGQNKLIALAVDEEGRIIMLPYGFDGTAYRILKVDEEGRMISVMKGQADVTWELHGWWKFIASEALIVKDYSGYGNVIDAHSGGNGAVNYADGVIGQAIEFNGVNAYLGLLDDASLMFANAMTVEVWVKFTVSQSSRLVRMDGDGIDHGYYMLSIITDKAAFGVLDHAGGSTSEVTGTTDIADGDWHHLVGTTDRTYVKIYVDGTHEATVADLTSEILGWHRFVIGCASGVAEFFAGTLDEVRVYDRCLSQDEVSWRYANTNPATGKPTRMVAVDNEGRMLVNIEGLPYKDQILLHDFVQSPDAGSTINVYSDAVPQGKIWVIESCNIDHDTDTIGTLQIGIDRGGVFKKFVENMAAGVNDTLRIETPLYLKAGDKVQSRFLTASEHTYCHMYCNGYELNLS